jgi:hypothetical protein
MSTNKSHTNVPRWNIYTFVWSSTRRWFISSALHITPPKIISWFALLMILQSISGDDTKLIEGASLKGTAESHLWGYYWRCASIWKPSIPKAHAQVGGRWRTKCHRPSYLRRSVFSVRGCLLFGGVLKLSTNEHVRPRNQRISLTRQSAKSAVAIEWVLVVRYRHSFPQVWCRSLRQHLDFHLPT